MPGALTLHVGLAKTGSTFYQREVFPYFREYLGKRYGISVPHPTFASFEKLHFDYLRGRTAPHDFDKWAKQNLNPESRLFLSSEALALWRLPDRANASFSGPRYNFSNQSLPSMHPLLGFLRQLQMTVGGQIRIILALRNQTDLLASHFAHGGLPGGSGLVQVANSRDGLLDYFSLVNSIQRLVGAENLLVLLFEDGFERNSARIADFLAEPDQVPLEISVAQRFHNARRIDVNNWEIRRQPKLVTSPWFLAVRRALIRRPLWFLVARGPYSWVLRFFRPRSNGVIRVSSKDRAEVMRSCQVSNLRLAQLLRRDLNKLGY